jgi:glutaryl-CoA dehydrogenase
MSAEATDTGTLEDYYRLDETLSDDERELRDRVREFGDREIPPIVNDYRERADFPFELVPKLAELNVAGTTIQGYGCPGLSRLGAGVVSRSWPAPTAASTPSWATRPSSTGPSGGSATRPSPTP